MPSEEDLDRALQRLGSMIFGLLVIGLFMSLLYLIFADDPSVPAPIDSTGYISHKVETSISAQSSWMVGESKSCTSIPFDAELGSALGEKPGYAFDLVKCDDGPYRNIKVTFWGARNQPGKTAAFWSCTRTSESFTCKQTGAD